MNSIASSFVKIFSPPRDDAPTSWPAAPFTGRIAHHEGRARPFKDGFAGGAAAKGAEAAQAEAAPKEEPGYLSGAVQGLMGKNFEGKDEAAQPTTGAEGWTGDLHGRKRDGFHVPKH